MFSDIFNMYPCIKCQNEVTWRQQAIQCEQCGSWIHRKCGTGISQAQYRAAVKGNNLIEWKCEACQPLRPSSHEIDESPDLPPAEATIASQAERNRDSLEGPEKINAAISQDLPPLSFTLSKNSSQRLADKVSDNRLQRSLSGN